MKIHTALLGILAALPLSLAGATIPAQAANGGNQLVCFDGESEGAGNGTCRLIDNGAALDNPAAGDYSGVYVRKDGLQGKSLGAVTQLSFKYTRTVAGGAPRLSLAIDEDGNGSYEFFAFADPNGCSGGADGTKANLVDVINDPTCLITTNNGSSYPNYAAFVAANKDAKYATDQVSFVISDQPGRYRVVQVKLGRSAAHGG